MNTTTSEYQPVVSVRNLKKTFISGLRRRKVFAVKEVNFQLMDNEVVGLVGPNGAGKTTTMKMMTGLVRPEAGVIEMFGLNTFDPKSREKLGYLPENPYFYEHLTGTELLRFYGNLFGMTGESLNRRVDELIERVGLKHAAKRAIKNYSKGMRQRVGIAQALINDPKLIILDEPQSGLDPIGRREIRELILEQKHLGKTVLFSSHILPDVEAVCDRIIIMKQGRSVELKGTQWNNLLAKKETVITFALASEHMSRIEAIRQEIQQLNLDADLEITVSDNCIQSHTSSLELVQKIIAYGVANHFTILGVDHQEVDYEALLMNVLDTPSDDKTTD